MHHIERLRYLARAGPVPTTLLVRESAKALAWFADDPMGLVTSCRRLVDRRRGCGPLMWLAARMLTGGDPRQEASDAIARISRDPTAHELEYALPHQARVLLAGHVDIAARALSNRPDVQALDIQALDVPTPDVQARDMSTHDIQALDVQTQDAQTTDVRALAVPTVPAGTASDADMYQITGRRRPATLRRSASNSGGIKTADMLLIESNCVGPVRALVPIGANAAARWALKANIPVWLVAGVGRTLPGVMWEEVAAGIEIGDGYELDTEDADHCRFDTEEADQGRFDGGDADRYRIGGGYRFDVVELDRLVTNLVTPEGLRTPAQARARRPECPYAPELLDRPTPSYLV